MRYKGTVYVHGFYTVIVDRPGITIKEARQLVEQDPCHFRLGPIEAVEFDSWENELQQTEGDEKW